MGGMVQRDQGGEKGQSVREGKTLISGQGRHQRACGKLRMPVIKQGNYILLVVLGGISRVEEMQIARTDRL